MLYIHWMLNTHADINRSSNCSSVNWSTRKTFTHAFYLAVTQTDYRHHLLIQQPIPVVYFIDSFIYSRRHSPWLSSCFSCRHNLAIRQSMCGPFHSFMHIGSILYTPVPDLYILIVHPFIHKLLHPWDIYSFTDSNIVPTQCYNSLPCDFSCPNKTQLVECLAGSYAATGSVKCQPCPKGAFCPTKLQPTYHLCANGTYSDIEGLSDCKTCDAGFRCPSVGLEAPEECPNGTYSNSTRARYCLLCPQGHRWGFGYKYSIGRRTDHSSIHPFMTPFMIPFIDVIGWCF